MVFNYKSLVDIEGRILLYLLDNNFNDDELNTMDAPENLTTHGIAEAISTDHRHMAYHIKRLTTQEYIVGTNARVKVKKRKQRIFSNTESGAQKAKELKEKIIEKKSLLLDRQKK
jgi:DNA-binding PadR family transcriptional regulator